MKILAVGAKLFHTDGRTDMTQLIVAFRNFLKAPKENVVTKYVCSIAVCFVTLTC